MPTQKAEVENELGARKRISLACQRCRKRKIKCEPSGVLGDGEACLACRASKAEHCQFLRVNSGEIYCTSPGSYGGAWGGSVPSPERTAFTVVPMANDLCQYSVSHPSQMAKATARLPTRIGGRHISQQLSPGRPYPMIAPHNNTPYDYEGVVPAQMGLQSFAQSNHAQDEMGQSWHAIDESATSALDSFFAQRPILDFPSIAYSDTTLPGNNSPSAPLFSGISPLATNLPIPEGLSSHRSLPNPAVYAGHMGNASSSGQSSGTNFGPPISHYGTESESEIWPTTAYYLDRSIETAPATCNADTAYPASPSSGGPVLVGDESGLYTQSSNDDAASPLSEAQRVAAANDEAFGNSASRNPASRENPSSENAESQTGDRSPETRTIPHRHYRLLQPQPQHLASRLPSLTHVGESHPETGRKLSTKVPYHGKKSSSRPK